MTTVVLTSELAARMNLLLDSQPLESAGVLFCRTIHNADGLRLLAVEFRAYADTAYVVRDAHRITISPSAVNDMLNHARENSLSVIQVHSHPGVQDATFSDVDDAGEVEMIPAIFRRVPARMHGALVLGENTGKCRIYSTVDTRAFARILVVGTKIERLDLVTEYQDERFDRSSLAFGRSGQARLRDLRIAVVGLGGTGSLVAQQLSYLGIRNIVFIDSDIVEVTNLNRLAGASRCDVGSRKVDVAARSYSIVEPDALIRVRHGDILDERVARELFDRDLVLCCTDSQASRALLNILAYQTLLPVIDMGVEISAPEGIITGVSGRIQLVGPQMPCLHCCNVIDYNALRIELLTEDQRERDAYVVGTHVTQPAVISLNATVVSLAMTMLIAMTTNLPMTARMQTYFGLRGEVRSATANAKEDCWICSDSSIVFGKGETLKPMWCSAQTSP